MNKRGGFGPIVIIIASVIFLILVISQGPGFVKYMNEKFFGGSLRPKTDSGTVIIPGTVTGEAEVVQTSLTGTKQEALRTLVEITLSCWQGFTDSDNTDQLCRKIVPTRGLQGSITEDDYVKALDKSGDLGRDLAGTGAWGMDPNNYAWNVGTVNSRSPTFFACVDNDVINEVVFTRNTKGGDCS